MATLNKVILIGNLTADPELKQTPSGISVVSFTIAINRRYQSKATGETQQTADFITVPDQADYNKKQNCDTTPMNTGCGVQLPGNISLCVFVNTGLRCEEAVADKPCILINFIREGNRCAGEFA